jgi:hypothetical protein
VNPDALNSGQKQVKVKEKMKSEDGETDNILRHHHRRQPSARKKEALPVTTVNSIPPSVDVNPFLALIAHHHSLPSLMCTHAYIPEYV